MKRKISFVVSALIFSTLLIGCTAKPFTETVFVRQRYPILDSPDRPQLKNVPATEMQKLTPEARQAVTENFNSLIDYSRKYEATVNIYNSFAVQQNDASKMYVGIRDQELYGTKEKPKTDTTEPPKEK